MAWRNSAPDTLAATTGGLAEAVRSLSARSEGDFTSVRTTPDVSVAASASSSARRESTTAGAEHRVFRSRRSEKGILARPSVRPGGRRSIVRHVEAGHSLTLSAARHRHVSFHWNSARYVHPTLGIDGDAKPQPRARLRRCRHVTAHVVPTLSGRCAAKVGIRGHLLSLSQHRFEVGCAELRLPPRKVRILRAFVLDQPGPKARVVDHQSLQDVDEYNSEQDAANQFEPIGVHVLSRCKRSAAPADSVSEDDLKVDDGFVSARRFLAPPQRSSRPTEPDNVKGARGREGPEERTTPA